MLVVLFGGLLGASACRPASYEKDVRVMVPVSPPSDGPGAEPPAPRGRVLYPAQDVRVVVPYDEVMPRGLDKATVGGR
ncbi:MAG: hypothetical protein AAGF11_14775 [Myxococcota bacterium]